MKIVFTVNTYYPYKDGVSVVTQYLAEGLAQNGHDVTVFTSAYDGAPDEDEHLGVKINRDNIKTVHAIHRGNKREYQQKMIAVSKEVDVIINVCTQTARTDWILPVLDKLSCAKVLYLHGMIEFEWHSWDVESAKSFASKLWNNIRYGWLYKSQGKSFKKYDAITQLHEFDYANFYFKKHYGIKSTVFENATSNAFFRNEPSKQNPSHTLICVANYLERKNQEMCMEAFYKAENTSDWSLRFIGSEKTPYYNYLIKKKEELDLQYKTKKSVVFDTAIPREEIPEIVKNAEIYLLGSEREAFPISIVETMAAGVPFISMDVGVVRYFPGGVIVKNTDEMSYWIQELIANEELRLALGNTGNAFALAHFRIDDKVEQLEQLLSQLVEDNK